MQPLAICRRVEGFGRCSRTDTGEDNEENQSYRKRAIRHADAAKPTRWNFDAGGGETIWEAMIAC